MSVLNLQGVHTVSLAFTIVYLFRIPLRLLALKFFSIKIRNNYGIPSLIYFQYIIYYVNI